MRYIFVAGAPGSKWSSVVKNIYWSSSVDHSDYQDHRSYSSVPGSGQIMHLGAYFDPGMEFDLPESLADLTRDQAQCRFDSAFSGTGIRIIKSHIFSLETNIQYLKRHWPQAPLVLVHRDNDACLGWWVRSGHFDISYPNYAPYYRDFATMASRIDQQNQGILAAWQKYPGPEPHNNFELAQVLDLDAPPGTYRQNYQEHNIRVKVI